jgi:hypothetical protein
MEIRSVVVRSLQTDGVILVELKTRIENTSSFISRQCQLGLSAETTCVSVRLLSAVPSAAYFFVVLFRHQVTCINRDGLAACSRKLPALCHTRNKYFHDNFLFRHRYAYILFSVL